MRTLTVLDSFSIKNKLQAKPIIDLYLKFAFVVWLDYLWTNHRQWTRYPCFFFAFSKLAFDKYLEYGILDIEFNHGIVVETQDPQYEDKL